MRFHADTKNCVVIMVQEIGYSETVIFVVLCILSFTLLSVKNEEEVTQHPLHIPPEKIKAALLEHKIIPDILEEAPTKGIHFEWVHGPKANYGNMLEPLDVLREPYWIKWEFDVGTHYTLMMFGLDEPSRENYTLREWQFWLVGNIPEYSVRFGDILTYYLGPKPPKGSGTHRYLALLYIQPNNGSKVQFDEKKKPIYDIRDDKVRGKWSHKKFAEKYNLGKPIACNFFQVRWAPSRDDNDTHVA